MKIIQSIDDWWSEDIDGCPRHLLWPKTYTFWDWVLRPGADMGFMRWLQWVRRKE